MTNRILDFSEAPRDFGCAVAQLVVERQNRPEVSVPLVDLAVVLAAHPQVTFTQAVLSGLASCGGVFVTCNGQNLPVGMLLPLAIHTTQAERFAAQARASVPTRKRLWQQIVRAKVGAQASVLEELYGSDFGISALVERVHSGDPKNIEARARPVLAAIVRRYELPTTS